MLPEDQPTLPPPAKPSTDGIAHDAATWVGSEKTADGERHPAASMVQHSGLPQVGGYQLEGELGRGGMGIVYLARQLKLNRLVALKMILNANHSDESTRQRFLAEAEAIARLQHSGIVQVFEFGTHEGNPFFALEYVSGGSLDKKLAGVPQPAREAAELVEKLTRAVQSAHDQGIIHRDLKPANILLCPDAPVRANDSAIRAFTPKITDFGLVKKEGSDMTATGVIMGTPSYMAPEQADSKKLVGPHADVYALGAILYECLTGRPPFQAATPLDTVLQVVHHEPASLRQLQSKTPLDLETICLKCLQKEPGKRYSSAAELGDDLQRFLNHEPIQARPVGRVEKWWRWCRRHPAVTGLTAGIAVLLIGAIVVSAVMVNWVHQAQEQTALVQTERNANRQLLSALLDMMKDKDEKGSSGAIQSLVQLGTAATAAVPELIKLLDASGNTVTPADEARVEKYAMLLSKFGTNAIPSLRRGLTSQSITRWGCVKALGMMGPPAQEAVPDLQKLLQLETNELIQRDIKDALDKISKK